MLCLVHITTSNVTSLFSLSFMFVCHRYFLCACNVWGPGDGPLEMYFEKTRTRRRKREKDSERYSPESGHIRKRYGDWREYLVVR